MKTRGLVLLCALATALCVSTTNALGKTAGCPCSPCKCSPCTCGGGSKSGGGKHHHGNDHSSSAGVGGTVDLSGIGHRTAEPNPFGVGGSEKPVAHTEEKRTATRKDHEPTNSNFDEIKLTGRDAKDENNHPNTFNIDNEQPPGGGTDAIGDLKKAHDDYHNAWGEWVKKQPNWDNLVHDWTQSPNTEEGNKKSAKAKKKIDNLAKQFDAGDGKQLVDDWKSKFDNALKSGATVDDNSLIPPPKDDIEKKKFAVIKARNDLKSAQVNYDDKRKNAANENEEVKKAQKALSDLGAIKADDPKYKAAVADIDKAINQAGSKWASTEDGKAEAKKLHDAEKELDKAKDAWKPFEKYEDKKSASNQ